MLNTQALSRQRQKVNVTKTAIMRDSLNLTRYYAIKMEHIEFNKQTFPTGTVSLLNLLNRQQIPAVHYNSSLRDFTK